MTARAPAHLSPSARKWWAAVARTFVLEPHDLVVTLTTAGEFYDAAQEAAQAIHDHGLVVLDRYGKPKANPAWPIYRDAKLAMLRALRELDLAGASPELPRIPGRK